MVNEHARVSLRLREGTPLKCVQRCKKITEEVIFYSSSLFKKSLPILLEPECPCKKICYEYKIPYQEMKDALCHKKLEIIEFGEIEFNNFNEMLEMDSILNGKQRA